MRYALALERELGKDQILTRYLNIAYFGAGAYGIAAASKRYFSNSPADLTLAQAALLAGLVRSPDSDDPINGDADAALRRRAYVLDRLVEPGQVAGRRGGAAKAEPLSLRPSETPNDCTAVPGGAQRLGLLLRLVHPLVERPAGVRGHRRRAAAHAAPGRVSIVSSLDPAVQRATTEQVLADLPADRPAGGADRGGPAGHRPGAGDGGEPELQRGGQPGRAEEPPEHRQPARRRRRRRSRATRAARRSSSSPCWPRWSPGCRWTPSFDAPDPDRSPATRSTRAGELRRPLVPGQRQPGRRWTAPHHVDRLRPLGEHLLRLADRAGRRGPGGGDGRAAGHRVPRRPTTPGWPGTARRTGVRSPSASPPPPRSTWPTRTPRWRPRAPGARRCRWSRSPTPPGGRWPPAQPDCRQVVDTDVARAAADAARCPVGDQSMYRRCDGGTARGCGAKLGRPVAGKTGSSERVRDGDGGRVHPAARGRLDGGEPGRPAGRGRPGGAGPDGGRGGPRCSPSRLRDQPVRDFVPPSERTAFQLTGPRAGN